MSFELNIGKAGDATERGKFVPTSVNNLLSKTSEAHLCFTQQKFSAKLQTHMVDYVISVSGLYSVYA